MLQPQGDRIADTRRQIAGAQNLVLTQEKLVQRIKAEGGDATEAHALLEVFAESLKALENYLQYLAGQKNCA